MNNHMADDLYSAVVADNVDVLVEKDWLQVRDKLTPANNSVLHLACQYGSRKCVDEILKHADESLLLQINSRGETALHLAARQGHHDATRALVKMAKSRVLSQPDNLENTSPTILQKLIRASNVEAETALHAAARFNHEGIVIVLVGADRQYSYPPNKYGETPLYLAALKCYLTVMIAILLGCDSPTYGGPGGRTALHAVLMNSEEDDIKHSDCAGFAYVLTTQNRDLLSIADDDGWTAFHFAAYNNLCDAMRCLLQTKKLLANQPDKRHRRTALHIAALEGHSAMLKLILSYLPDAWENLDENGQNILHLAAKQNQKSEIKTILLGIQNFNTLNTLLIQRDNDGNTPLHLMAKAGYHIPELLDWNIDWDALDNTNSTPPQMLHQKFKSTLVDEELVGVTLGKSKTPVHSYHKRWTYRELSKNDDSETSKEKIKRYREMANSHMIVAALITTVALTAGFAMPGGFDGNQGGNQGSPILLRMTAFKTFVIADTVALLFSISSLFLYFLTSFKIRTVVIFNMLISAIVCNVASIAAMMVAFIAGTYGVLSHSKVLAIHVCIISSLFLLLVLAFCFVPLRRMTRRLILTPLKSYIRERSGEERFLYEAQKEVWDV